MVYLFFLYSEHKDSEKKHKEKEKTKHKDGSSEKHKDKHKDRDKEKRKEEKVQNFQWGRKSNGMYFSFSLSLKAGPESTLIAQQDSLAFE